MQKQSETESTPSKRGKQDLKGKQATRKTDGNTDDVNTKAETEVIPDSKEPEATPMKTHKGRKLKVKMSLPSIWRHNFLNMFDCNRWGGGRLMAHSDGIFMWEWDRVRD